MNSAYRFIQDLTSPSGGTVRLFEPRDTGILGMTKCRETDYDFQTSD